MSTKEDRLKYDNYFYNPETKKLIQISRTDYVSKMFTPHHYIRQQWIRNNPNKFKKVEYMQKIIFLPTFVPNIDNMHADVHNNNRNFEEKWGLPIDLFIFNEK